MKLNLKVQVSDNCLMPYFRGKIGEIKQVDNDRVLVVGRTFAVWLYKGVVKEIK